MLFFFMRQVTCGIASFNLRYMSNSLRFNALMKRCRAGWVSAESWKSDKFFLYRLFVSFCVLDDEFDLPGRVAAYPVQEVSSEINEQFSFLSFFQILIHFKSNSFFTL